MKMMDGPLESLKFIMGLFTCLMSLQNHVTKKINDNLAVEVIGRVYHMILPSIASY